MVPQIYSWLSSVRLGKCWDNTAMRPPSLAFRSFPIHLSSSSEPCIKYILNESLNNKKTPFNFSLTRFNIIVKVVYNDDEEKQNSLIHFRL
jgi:hypothetical protein